MLFLMRQIWAWLSPAFIPSPAPFCHSCVYATEAPVATQRGRSAACMSGHVTGFLSSQCNSDHQHWGVWLRSLAESDWGAKKGETKRPSVKNARRNLSTGDMTALYSLNTFSCGRSGNRWPQATVFQLHAKPFSFFFLHSDVLQRKKRERLHIGAVWDRIDQSGACFSLCLIKKKKKLKKKPQSEMMRKKQRFLALMQTCEIKDHVSAHQHGITGI